MSIPSIPPGGGEFNPANQAGAQSPFPPVTGSSDDAWLKFAQQMFPGDPDAMMYVAPLKKNMMSMIGNTIAEINTRQQIANQYNEQVAKGEA